jgi:hypothetical protein
VSGAEEVQEQPRSFGDARATIANSLHLRLGTNMMPPKPPRAAVQSPAHLYSTPGSEKSLDISIPPPPPPDDEVSGTSGTPPPPPPSLHTSQLPEGDDWIVDDVVDIFYDDVPEVISSFTDPPSLEVSANDHYETMDPPELAPSPQPRQPPPRPPAPSGSSNRLSSQADSDHIYEEVIYAEIRDESKRNSSSIQPSPSLSKKSSTTTSSSSVDKSRTPTLSKDKMRRLNEATTLMNKQPKKSPSTTIEWFMDGSATWFVESGEHQDFRVTLAAMRAHYHYQHPSNRGILLARRVCHLKDGPYLE